MRSKADAAKKTCRCAVIYGYDPMFAIMHYERDGSPAFVLDPMEPEPPKVDRAVLAFLKSEALHPADFTNLADGWYGSIRRWRGE